MTVVAYPLFRAGEIEILPPDNMFSSRVIVPLLHGSLKGLGYPRRALAWDEPREERGPFTPPLLEKPLVFPLPIMKSNDRFLIW